MTQPRLFWRPINASEVYVRGGEPLAEWRNANSLLVPGARFTTLYKKGKWDGLRRPGRFMRRIDAHAYELRCSYGLLCARLIKDFNTLPGIGATPFSDSELKQIPFIIKDALRGRSLRDYQEVTINTVLRTRWGRVALATNAGKGAIIALIALVLYRLRKLQTLILADEIAVFNALRDEVMDWTSLAPQLVESGTELPPTRAPITVAMVQTLARRLKTPTMKGNDWFPWLRNFGVVLLDEADKSNVKTWKNILANCTNSGWRAGFSGSFPTDALGLLAMDELLGPEVIFASNRVMIDRGISAHPTVSLIKYNALPSLLANKVSSKEWRAMKAPARRLSVYERAVVHNTNRHLRIKRLIRPGVRTCIIVNRVDHGHELAHYIPGSIFLSGSASKTERDEVVQRFRDGEFSILIATKIFDRGTNQLGDVNDLIFASGEGSRKQTLQRIGRGLRRADGKEFLRVVDIIDRGHPFLEKAARKRVQLYNEEGFDIEVGEEHTVVQGTLGM